MASKKGGTQSYSHKELNSANNHVNLEEYSKLQKNMQLDFNPVRP